MSKFNKAKTVNQKLRERPDATTNHEGGLAFKPGVEMELYLRVVSSFMEDTYYTKQSQQLKDLQTAIAKTSREFVLKLANYARNEMKLRSIPMVLLAEAANEIFPGDTKGISKAMVTEYAPKIIRRADELSEVLAYSINMTGMRGSKKKMPNSLKKGVAKAFHNFDEYQFAKYNRKGDVTLKDAVLMSHPKPKDAEQKALFKRILDDELKTPETWEVEISTKGSTAENWNKIAPKMGLMALVRNLRNFEQKDAKEALKIAYAALRNADHVQKSRMLPFRFYTATKHVSTSASRDALMDAMDLAVANLPKVGDNVAIFSDVSGSMSCRVSGKSETTCMEIATLFGAMAAHLTTGSDYTACAFATDVGDAKISKRDSIITNANKIKSTNTNGHGTDAWKIFPYLRKNKLTPDVIFVFSDMQCYNTSGYWSRANGETLASGFRKYRAEVNPNAVLVSVDLQSYGSLQFPEDEKNVLLLGGWSEQIFKLVPAYKERVSVLDIIKNNF